MTARFRRVAVFVGTAALATGTGIGVAASQGDATDRNSGTPAGIERSRLDLRTPAEKLGVSEAELQKAMQTARSAGPDGMFAAVAEELGVSADKVREAFAAAMPQPNGQTAPPSGGGQAAPQTTTQS